MAYMSENVPNLGHVKEALERTDDKITDVAGAAAGAIEDLGDRVGEALESHAEDTSIHLDKDEKEYLDNPPQFSGIGNVRLKEILGW